jgi:hypothetical protein
MKKSGILLSFFAGIFMMILTGACRQSDKGKSTKSADTAGNMKIGWASANITPDKPILLAGQFHARVSEGVRDPITATALAIESGEGDNTEKAIMISCDLVGINDNLRDEVRKRLKETLPQVKSEQILINATHTHTAPLIGTDTDSKSFYGVELEAMSPAACLEFVSERVAKAAEQAWKERKPGGISFGLGQAVVGHNRLRVTMDGKSAMYGKTNVPEFSHLEGLEDHSVNLLYTWNRNSELTGVVINLASSSQVSEQDYLVSADYWNDTRLEVRKRLGKDLFILPQCSAAGDQSPHVMIGEKAEARMQRLMFSDSIQTGRSSIGQRKQIAVKIADAVTSVLPYMKNCIEWSPKFAHRTENVQLSRRLIGMEDVKSAIKESEEYKKQYEQMLADIAKDPTFKQKNHWYFDITRTYTLTKRGKSVSERFELEKKQPKMPVEVHVLRIGDVAIATNPFELYLDYGMRIKGRSPAVQTFLIQLTGSGTYLPVARSVAGGSYGAVPASTLIGPEGGQELVEKTLEMINTVFRQ